MENGQKLLSFDCGKDIFSFAVSGDGSLIAVSERDDYDTITIVNLKENSRLNIISSGERGPCGFLRFTSDQNTLVYGFQYSTCADEASCLYCESAYNGVPGFNFITPLNNIHLPGKKNLEEAEFTPFVLWPRILSGALTKNDFTEQNKSSSWLKKIQRRMPNLFAGFSLRLDDETVLAGSPEHSYVMMLNVGILQSESDFTDTKRIIDLHKREIVFSLEGDAIYFIISEKSMFFSSPPSSITVWRMSTREILTSKTFSGPTSIAPMKTGVLLVTTEKPRIVAELWNFELSECNQRIVELTSKTAMLYRAIMFPVSDNRIAFFYHLNSYELKCISSSRNREENQESPQADLLESADGNINCIDFIDVTNFGGKLISSLRIKADLEEILNCTPSSSSLSQVLVCSSRIIKVGNGLVDEEQATVSLRNEGFVTWKRDTTFYNSMCLNPQMILSPKNEFVVTWNTLTGGKGLHILNASTGETLHVFFEDQEDIVDCKFLDDEAVVCCCKDNFLRLYNVRTGDLLTILDIGEQPFCLGACLYQLLVVIGLSETRIKFVHVHLPTESKKKK